MGDDPSAIETYAQTLRVEGFTVLTALNAAAGLRDAEAFRPDAVVLDLRMPLDRVAFLRQIDAQKAQRHTPVVIVTGEYSADEQCQVN